MISSSQASSVKTSYRSNSRARSHTHHQRKHPTKPLPRVNTGTIDSSSITTVSINDDPNSINRNLSNYKINAIDTLDSRTGKLEEKDNSCFAKKLTLNFKKVLVNAIMRRFNRDEGK